MLISKRIHNQLRFELTGMMLKGGFPLRKWTSNRLEVLQGLDASQIGTKSSLQFDTDETIKALGVCWEPERDNLCFASNIMPIQLPSTKRSICSEIARLFDPLGLLKQPSVIICRDFPSIVIATAFPNPAISTGQV